MSGELPWREQAGALLLSIRLTPKSSRDALEGIETLSDGRAVLKARVRAVPEDGKANDALIRLVAKELDVPRRAVELASGATSRTKVLSIAGADAALIARLSRFAGA
jgi:uncharacterized protein (TIGR00251 family)